MKSDGGILVLIGLAIALVGCGPLLFGYVVAAEPDTDLTSQQAFMLAATAVGGFFIALGLLTGWRRINPFSGTRGERVPIVPVKRLR
jgi:hypothetical protein